MFEIYIFFLFSKILNHYVNYIKLLLLFNCYWRVYILFIQNIKFYMNISINHNIYLLYFLYFNLFLLLKQCWFVIFLVSAVQHSDSVFSFVEIWFSYNTMLVSEEQHSDSIFLKIIFHYRLTQENWYNPLLYRLSLLLIYFIYSSLYLLILYP